MGNSSSSADPTVTDEPYTLKKSPKVTRLKVSNMAATMDTPMPHHEDLNLMGLQELDSHLSIFESSNPDRDSSTPGDISDSGFGDSINTFDQHYNTIIVESPTENYAPNTRFEVGSRARFAEQKFNHIIKYVLCSLFPVI
jgi:hypothetical protein